MAPTAILPAGRNAHLFNDDVFRQMRNDLGIADDFINEGWALDSLQSSGAKGGCMMTFLGSEYILKELSEGDHLTLLTIARSYFNHVRGGGTLLAAIVMHFEDTESGRRFFAMRNVLGEGPFLAKYDLKGCNDDKTLELFGDKLSDCGTGKVAAFNMDLVVTSEQRISILQMMERDTRWLVSNQLMDYSLIVGIKTGPPGFVKEGCLGQRALVQQCRDGSEVAVSIGIIDFLQRWTWYKKVAKCIKCLEHNKATVPPKLYAERFNTHFEERFVPAKFSEVLSETEN